MQTREYSDQMVRQRVLDVMTELPPQEQRAAHHLLDHLADAASYSATELATAAGVSKATMSRLSRSLGFASFAALRDRLRATSRDGAPRIAEAPHTTADVLVTRHIDAIAHQVHELVDYTDELTEIAQQIAVARRVSIVGFRSSYPAALHFRQQLMQLRGNVEILPHTGQTMAEELVDMDTDDYLVLVALGRRIRGESDILSYTQSRGISTALLGDRSARSLSTEATKFVELATGTPGALMSLAHPMTALSIIAELVAVKLGTAAQSRVDAISDGYIALGELEVNW